MAIAGMSEEKRLEVVASTMKVMEALEERMRELIAAQPTQDLLGYIYAQRVLRALHEPEGTEQPNPADNPSALIDDTQFLLEYVHAALASTPSQGETSFNEAACAELFELATKLKTTAMFHAMASSVGTENGAFGPNTADVEFQAKSTWVLLRGNRYQVLEGEFYTFVLAPHDALLRVTYGIGADEIAAGFQDMANAVRMGHADAVEEMAKQFHAAETFAAKLTSSRDAKRANSAAEITGAGTFSAIASAIVQRPSPESSTHGAMSSSLLPCSSNAVCSYSSSLERTTEP